LTVCLNSPGSPIATVISAIEKLSADENSFERINPMKWKTRITDLLGIKYPIIEGALANIGRAQLAAAVSDAGGLGMITAWTLRTPEKLRAEIKKVRALTDKPFAVNLSPTVDPILGPMREVAIEEKVPVIETAGYRAEDHGKRIKEAGLLWFHKVQTVKHAVSAQRAGADAVCIMGLEGAGLKSPIVLPTFLSVPLVAKAVDIPVIAAGGIGDARSFLGALALGAEAVLLGTAFCAVKECPLSDRHKQALIAADPYDSRYRDPILYSPKPEEIKAVMEATDTKGIMKSAADAEEAGLPKETGLHTLSLAIGYIDKIPTAKELIEEIVHDAEKIMTHSGIGGWKLSPDSST
jgi:NAD(P)H-dependent flavin oxidoreductase YrpB (nitropropane dioxygenase family)